MASNPSDSLQSFEAEQRAVLQTFFTMVNTYVTEIRAGIQQGGENIIAAGELFGELVSMQSFWEKQTKDRPVFVGSFARGYKDAMANVQKVATRMAIARTQYLQQAIDQLKREFSRAGVNF